MSSIFDFDDSYQVAFHAKTAGKAIIAAKYDIIKNTGDFLFNSHSDGEFVERCTMIDDDITRTAHNKLSNVSDSKMKLVKALHTEWSLRHAKCIDCNCGGTRKFAKSTCEMCKDGEIDPNSNVCKSCGIDASLNDIHGTPTGYASGCRCGDCKDAMNSKIIELHGTPKEYASGCRCDVCKDAMNPGIGRKDYGGHVKILPNEGGPLNWEKEKWASKTYNSSRTANKYIEKRGDSWVILQKGTGKVLSHHDSKEKAEESFRAMMQNKNGSQGDQKKCAECGEPATKHDVRGYLELCDNCHRKTSSSSTWVVAHMEDGDYCPNCDNSGCSNCIGNSNYCNACQDPNHNSCPSTPGCSCCDSTMQGCPNCMGQGCEMCTDEDDNDFEDVMRHDQGHDDWHAMYGDAPCTSDQDCAEKSMHYDNIDNMRDKGEPIKESNLHDELHEKWHRDHGDSPCTSLKDCEEKSANYDNVGMDPNGENMEDIMRHDQGHDDWHAMHGDSPCTSEEDCASKSANYKN
jgi:hypothetical protein